MPPTETATADQRFSGVKWKAAQRSSKDSKSQVEVAFLPRGEVAVRHSDKPNGPYLVYTRDEWIAFTGGVKDGNFDEW